MPATPPIPGRVSLGYDNRYINSKGTASAAICVYRRSSRALSPITLFPARTRIGENFSFGARLLHEETDSRERQRIADRASNDQDQHLDAYALSRAAARGNHWSANDSTTATLLMPGYRLERTKADNVVQTSHGYRLSLEARGSSEYLLSTVTMLQLRQRQGIHRFGQGGRVTGRVGYRHQHR